MARAKRSFSPEFREDAVKMVIDSSRPIAQVAHELNVGEGTFGNWVSMYRRAHAGQEPPLDVSDRARLREVERQLREVRMENEFLKKPPRTSPRITSEREVRVCRNNAHSARMSISNSFDVPVAGGVTVWVL